MDKGVIGCRVMQGEQASKSRGLRFKSTDGMVFWVNGESCVDYVLHPVFLHYFTLCVLIFALLDPTTDSSLSTGWHLAMSWAIVTAISIAWLSAMTWVQRWLWRRRWITLIYTPLFLVPMVLFVDLARQYFAIVVGGADWQPWSKTILDIARDIFAVLLFDILHGRYVVLAHPNATPDGALPASAAAPSAQAEPAPTGPPADPAQDQPAESIRIGSATYALDTILTIRTRSHRLEVTTPQGSQQHRARMADLPEIQLARYGIQINRSLWVAFDAITDVIEADASQTDLRLWTGETERVARPRLHAFRQAWRAQTSAGPGIGNRQNTARGGGHGQTA